MKRNNRIAALTLWACLVIPSTAPAQGEVDLGIRTGFANRIPLIITPFQARDGTRQDEASVIEGLIVADLEFSGIFRIQRGDVPQVIAGDSEGLIEVRGVLSKHRDDVHFEGRVVAAESKRPIGGKRYKVKPGQLRAIAHHFSDEIVRMLTGEPGIATTSIVSRRQVEDNWEIVISDYDGYNPRVILRQSVPVMAPRWVDGSAAVAYTSFRHGKPDLFLRYLDQSASKRIASYNGLNYSVEWSEKRKELAATLSKDGNAEIYILSKEGSVKRRLTHSNAIDVSPSWSPSGREILFTSDRLGNPHIYVMEADGGNVRRLTFAGNYNESPAWSPRGDKIAFVSRIDGFFQLCTIRPDGLDLRVITHEPLNHEDPRWAPNGRHIVYTEEKRGEKTISIIDIVTRGKRILSQGETPDWSSR